MRTMQTVNAFYYQKDHIFLYWKKIKIKSSQIVQKLGKQMTEHAVIFPTVRNQLILFEPFFYVEQKEYIALLILL